MPLPKPRKNENQNAFMQRCMADPKVSEEFKNPKQRVAVCMSQWENKKESNK